MIQFILFLIIITVIVLVHEGGHFVIGRKSGIGVVEFSVGMGPQLFSIERGGVKYSLKALPFGGACQFEGYDPEDDSDSPTAFFHAPVWSRIATVLAGPMMNFVLAFFLSLFVVGSLGYDAPVVADVMEGYPAAEAGIQPGDRILKINHTHISVYRDISLYILLNESKDAHITIRRGNETLQTVLVPRYNPESGRYLFGMYGGERVKGNALTTIYYSAVEVRYWIGAVWKSLGMLSSGRLTKDDIAGPVGIAQTVGEVYEESRQDGAFYVWLNMLTLTIMLSANLGVMNLLPIPALDGGRLVFLLYEAVTHKSVNQKVEGMIHFIGICLLMVLMIFVLYNDVTRFFR